MSNSARVRRVWFLLLSVKKRIPDRPFPRGHFVGCSTCFARIDRGGARAFLTRWWLWLTGF